MEDLPSSSSNLTFSLGMGARKTALELALRDGEETVTRTTVSNDPEGHESLMSWLKDRGAGPEKTRVCMEASGDFQKAVALVSTRKATGSAWSIRGGLTGTHRGSFNLRRPILPMLPCLLASAIGRTRGHGPRPQRRRVGFKSLQGHDRR